MARVRVRASSSPQGRTWRSREPADFVDRRCATRRACLVDQAFLFPADHVDGMDPEMIAMARALRTPVVRFGGNFTSGYHWRDGIGPMDKRVTMLNQSWGMPEYNHFGTDEFLRFCKLIGAEPQIALNLGSGTPAGGGRLGALRQLALGRRRGRPAVGTRATSCGAPSRSATRRSTRGGRARETSATPCARPTRARG